MPLGDSITETTCQTQLLWKKLRDAGHTHFDLVGSKKNNQSCGVSGADQDCEGHGGYKTLQLVSGGKATAELEGWASGGKADVVLMHFGTNDVWNGAAVSPEPLIDAFGLIVDTFRAVNPNVVFFVAQIIPLDPNDPCASCNANAQALNAAVPGFASSKSSSASPVYVVDQYTGFDSGADTGDGVHPNLMGSQKMADNWYAALIERGIF
jgi:lysophospholipase L1-like esterase